MCVDIDVVEQCALRAGRERVYSLVGCVDAGQVLVADEGEADRGPQGRGAVVGGCPGVALALTLERIDVAMELVAQ